MILIYFHTKFHIPSSSSSLIIATKPNATYWSTFFEAILFYSLAKSKQRQENP